MRAARQHPIPEPPVEPMIPEPSAEPMPVTLLEIVRAIGEVTEDDREVVATVLHLLSTGQIRLSGNFRGSPLSTLT